MAMLDTTDNTSQKSAATPDKETVFRNHLVNATIKEIRDACSKPGETMRNMIIVDQTMINLQNADGGIDSKRFKDDLLKINQAINPDGSIADHKLPFLEIVGANNDGKTMVFDRVTGKTERLIDDDGVINPQIAADKNVLPKLFLTADDKSADAWKQSVNGDKVTQGVIGDCYFLSSVESLARKNPDAIKDMITDNGRGADGKHTYTVTFPGAPDNPVKVSAPNDYEVSAFSGDNGGLWTSILEKAHRKLTGLSTYDGGNYSRRGMALLTSDDPSVLMLNNATDEQFNAKLQQANDKNMMITCTTVTPNPVKDELGNLVSVADRHIYEIVGYDAQKGTVTVANPWGENKLDNKQNPNPQLIEDPNNRYVPSKFDNLVDRVYPGAEPPKTGRYLTMSVEDFKASFACITSAEIQSN